MCRYLWLVGGLVLLIPTALLAQDAASPDDPVAYAMSAAPPEVSAEATIMAPEGDILRVGTNGWTCIPMPNQPMCLDQEWMSWMDAYLNQADEVPTRALGIAYMLGGDAGASNTDPYAEAPTPDNEWVTTGPHLMIIVPDPALLAGLPTDPEAGGPYVMWAGHPLAHVMIPIEDGGVVVRD
jgi:hypothetical protein